MTDQPTPQPPPDETLAAYLVGDLDAQQAAAVDAALDDPDTAARLDALAETLVRLRRVDDVAPPDGYAERLRARLQAPAPGTPATVTTLDRARARRTWSGVGAAAAALVLLAVGSFAVLQGVGGGSGGDSAEVAGEQPLADADAGDEAGSAESFAAEEAAPQAAPEGGAGDGAPQPATVPDATPQAERFGVAEDQAGEQSGTVPAVPPAAEAAVPGPDVVVDDTFVAAPDDAAVLGAFADLPEVQAVMGLPLAEAETAAVAAARALASAPALAGAAPDACVQTALNGLEPPLIVRAQALHYAGEDHVAYVVASSEGGQVIDRAEVVVVEAATCTVLTTVPLAG